MPIVLFRMIISNPAFERDQKNKRLKDEIIELQNKNNYNTGKK